MVRKSRTSLKTLLAVVFTTITCALTAVACVFFVPPGAVYAAGSEQTADSFAKLEFGGTTTYYGDADTLGAAFSDANNYTTSADNTAKITILKEVEAQLTETISVEKHIELDLNGHKIDFKGTELTFSPITVNNTESNAIAQLTITDSEPTTPHKYTVEGGLYKFVDTGADTLYGGVITGGNKNVTSTSDGGGCISVSSKGTLIMKGGNIAGNRSSKHGGGIYVNGGTFELKSGKITGNVTFDNGGGIYVGGNGTFIVSGASVDITGNSEESGTRNNAYVNKVTIKIESSLASGEESASIGVSAPNKNANVMFQGFEDYDQNGKLLSDFFFFDDGKGLTTDDKGNLITCEHDSSTTTISIATQPTKKEYTAFEVFDKTGMVVKSSCSKCGTALEDEITNYTVVYSEGRKFLRASDTSVTIEYQGKKTTVSGLKVNKRAATVEWQYSSNVNVQSPVWGAWKETFSYNPASEGLNNNVRARFNRASNDTIYREAYRGTSSQVSITKNGNAEASVKNAGTYTLSLKESDFPDYVFTNNSATLTVNPLQIELNNEDNFYWLLDEYNSQLRTGYIYYNESDPADENNYRYYSTAGENRAHVIRSIVRYRNGEQLTIKIFGARSSDNIGEMGAYDITYNSGNVGAEMNKYTANATLTIKEEERENYEFKLTGTLPADRLMSATVSDDKKSVTVNKEWYIAFIDNGLRSQYTDEAGNTYGDEWKISGWTYGDYKEQYAPRLEHGDPDAEAQTIDFTKKDNGLVTFDLYKIVANENGESDEVKIGKTFSRSEFANYINATVPAGSYILHVYVKQATSDVEHTHWYDGQPHNQTSVSTFDSFETEFDFVVKKATFTADTTNADTLGNKTFTYTYDGSLHLCDGSFTLTFTPSEQRDGIWKNAEYDGYYGAGLRYHLERWGGNEFLTEEGLDGYENQTQTPKNAGTYNVYYKLVAPNYSDYGGK